MFPVTINFPNRTPSTISASCPVRWATSVKTGSVVKNGPVNFLNNFLPIHDGNHPGSTRRSGGRRPRSLSLVAFPVAFLKSSSFRPGGTGGTFLGCGQNPIASGAFTAFDPGLDRAANDVADGFAFRRRLGFQKPVKLFRKTNRPPFAQC